MKMNKHGIVSGLVLVVIGTLIATMFAVEYPCTISGCGCDSVWEMLHDTWAGLVGTVITLLGMILFIRSLLYGEKKDEQKT